MTHVHFTHTRTREHTPDYEPYHSRPLIHSDSKHHRKITLSDDSDNGHDDYPYSPSHNPLRTPRTLTLRDQSSQLARYNIWSDRRDSHSDHEDERRRSYERHRVYTYTARPTRRHDAEERDVQVNVQAVYSRPKTPHYQYHHHHESSHPWPTDVLRRKEKWVDEDWEMQGRSLSRERRRRVSFWGDVEGKGEEKESWSRYHRVKSTKTEEVVPLSGWRRNRILFGA